MRFVEICEIIKIGKEYPKHKETAPLGKAVQLITLLMAKGCDIPNGTERFKDVPEDDPGSLDDLFVFLLYLPIKIFRRIIIIRSGMNWRRIDLVILASIQYFGGV